MQGNTIREKIRRVFNVAVWRYLPPCKEIVKIVSASLDRRLTLSEKVIMKLHLAACEPCVKYLEQSKFLSEATHELDDELKKDIFTGQLSDEARKRIKDILRTSLA